jgi:translation initiation factor IF-1
LAKDDNIEVDGLVKEVLPSGLFLIDADGVDVMAHLSGKMRQNKIRVVLGDKVVVMVSPYDPNRGIISQRK